MDDPTLKTAEPLGISTFDTDPLDVGMETCVEEEVEVYDTDTEIESSDGEDDTSGRRTCLDFSEMDGGSNSTSSDEDEPQLDLRVVESYEVKRIYGDLIDSCRGFSDDNSERVLKENITKGDVLFRQMRGYLSKSFSGNEAGLKGIVPKGNVVSQLKMACQHTKLCSKMLTMAAKNLAAKPCIFNVDNFLSYLKTAAVDSEGTYSALVAVRKLAVTANSSFYTAPEYCAISWCIEKDYFVQTAKPAEKKVRLPRFKKHEQKNEKAAQIPYAEMEIDKDSTAEALAEDVLYAVKTKNKAHNSPQRMLEIVDGNDVSDIVNRLFGIAFVARDGLVGVTREGKNTADDSSLNLMITPEPPEKAGTKNVKDNKQKSHYIASFPSKLLKELVASGKEGK